MRVLIFRHVPFEGAGHLERVLQSRGIAFQYADLYAPAAGSPDPEDFQALIFMGGPMSVNDELAYLKIETQYIQRAAAEGIPLLGICLGSQLIAKALGARVHRNPAREIGWFNLTFTPAAASDPLFAGLDSETVFHWHGETFELPAGGQLLASSSLCRNQAYRVGHHIYGFQFHLEVTPEMIADWCLQDENCGDVQELTSPINPYYNARRTAELSDRVFGAWCDAVCASAQQ
jgi:GMP synthase-like glutamine amidotransferase